MSQFSFHHTDYQLVYTAGTVAAILVRQINPLSPLLLNGGLLIF